MLVKDKIKFLLWYLVVFYGLVFVGYWVFSQRNGNRKKYILDSSLLYSAKIQKYDPCFKSVFGEPLDSKDSFIKVNFFCSKDKNSKNTISLKVLDDRNVGAAIDELGRINQFDLDKNYQCFYEGNLVRDFSTKVETNKRIDCLESGLKITDIYPRSNEDN